MSPDLSEHDHCRFCGDAVPSDQAYCSLECYYNDQKRMKKEKNKETAWTALAIVGIVVILVAGYLF